MKQISNGPLYRLPLRVDLLKKDGSLHQFRALAAMEEHGLCQRPEIAPLEPGHRGRKFFLKYRELYKKDRRQVPLIPS